jgi:large subunit ribosomal protein L9
MPNKLLLLDDVDGLGRQGDVVNVRPGYARNFLLPEGLAVVADKRALRMQVRLQEERSQKAIVDKKEAEELAARFQDITLTTIVKIDHEGHMYGSVSSVDVIHLLKDQANIELERRNVQLPHPIKEIGVHTIKLKLKEGIPASFTLKVVPEEQPEAGKEAQAEEAKEHKKEAKPRKERAKKEAQ